MNFSFFSPEVQLHILRFLDVKTAIALGRTARFYHNLASDNGLWQYYYDRDFFVDTLSNKNYIQHKLKDKMIRNSFKNLYARASLNKKALQPPHDPQTGQSRSLVKQEIPFQIVGDSVWALDTNHSHFLVSAGEEGILYLYDPRTLTNHESDIVHGGTIYTIQIETVFSEKDQCDHLEIFSGSADGVIKMFQVPHFQKGEKPRFTCVREILGHETAVQILRLTPEKIYSASRGGTILVHRRSDGVLCDKFDLDQKAFLNGFQLVGKYGLISTNEGFLALFETSEAHHDFFSTFSLSGPPKSQTIEAIDFNGKEIVVGTQDGRIACYLFPDFVFQHDLKSFTQVCDLKIDRSVIVSAHADHVVNISDLHSGSLLHSLHTGSTVVRLCLFQQKIYGMNFMGDMIKIDCKNKAQKSWRNYAENWIIYEE